MLLLSEIVLQGLRIQFAMGGQDNGPVIVWLHGASLNHNQWVDIATSFLETHRVVLLDFPGFGQSEAFSSLSLYSYETLADIVLDLISALKLGCVTLVGQGFGAAVAIVIAADHPEFIERCVLVAPPCYPRSPDWFERLATLPLIGSSFFRYIVSPFIMRRYSNRNDSVKFYNVWLVTLAVLKLAFKPHAIEARLPRVRTPSLVLWGRHDPIAPCSHSHRLVRELVHARLEILDCDHHPELELPSEVSTLIRKFLAQTNKVS